MDYLKRQIVMAVLNVGSAVADEIVASMDRSGVNEDTATIREYAVGCRAAYADYRERLPTVESR